MTSRYLLDTNIAGYVIKGNVPAVRRRIVQVPMAQLAISAVTEGELRYGAARRPDAARLRTIVDEFLLGMTILPWDSEAAQRYGQIRPHSNAKASAGGLRRRWGRRIGKNTGDKDRRRYCCYTRGMGSGPAGGPTPRISSLLIKPASAVCSLDCAYCFYLDRQADPYQALPARRMSLETLERLVDTYLFYSYPESVFAFQGGEPTLAGLPFFVRLVEFEQQYGRDGQTVGNSLQTNGMLLDEDWCDLFRAYDWLLGVSLDGPQEVNDLYRVNKQGRGTWKRVIQSVELLQKQNLEFNILCVLSQANVGRPQELYRFFRGLGIGHLQFIPLAEFDQQGNPLPFTISPEQYGRFLCDLFELWWPDRRKVRIRFFDNIAEALAGQKPGNCTMHETCDSYVVVEYNGDVYPCDFFVESSWKLGNIVLDSWPEIARRARRYSFSSKKTLAHPECQACQYQSICHGGCPKLRHGPHGRFEDLDYFCQAYKMIYARSVEPLRGELRKLRIGEPARLDGR